MSATIYLTVLFVLVELALIMAAYITFGMKRRAKHPPLYHIKVKSAHGVVTKLILNQEQNEQFQAFMNQPDGVFEISDNKSAVRVERRYIAAVEVQVR